MSDATFSAIAGAMAQVADAITGIQERDGVVCYLLKREGQTKRFSSVQQLTAGWLVELDGVRDRIKFSYATTSDFADDWAEVTHIGYGVPDTDDNIEVFEIDPEQKDAMDPRAFSPFWSCMAVKVNNERYATA